MSEWHIAQLGEVANFKNGFAFKSSDFVDSGIPVIKIKNVKPNRINLNDLSYVSESVAKGKEKYLIESSDILISMSGNRSDGSPDSWVGKVSKFRFNGAYLLNQRVSIIQAKENLSDTDFLAYSLSSWETQQYLIGHANSSGGQANISPDTVKGMEIALPPLPEQKAIASVLSSLDDKIDLLHRQNQTLEAMAATLFRQWFVKEAQEDWEVRPLSSVANFLNGLACQKHPPKNELEKLPVLKIRELSGGISESSDWATSEIKPEYIVEAGDVIFAWSASLMVKVWDGERCVLNQHLFKVTSTESPKWFYLMWCKHHLAEFISISASHATTMGHIKRGDLDAAMVNIPSPEELKAMTDQMTPLLDKQISISKQIRTLEKFRDTLLPKLMSGDVRIEV